MRYISCVTPSARYIQLEKALYQDKNENCIVMAVKDPEQIKAMLEVDFNYVCQKGDLVFL